MGKIEEANTPLKPQNIQSIAAAVHTAVLEILFELRCFSHHKRTINPRPPYNCHGPPSLCSTLSCIYGINGFGKNCFSCACMCVPPNLSHMNKTQNISSLCMCSCVFLCDCVPTVWYAQIRRVWSTWWSSHQHHHDDTTSTNTFTPENGVW